MEEAKKEGEDEDGEMMGKCVILPSEYSSMDLMSPFQANSYHPELLQRLAARPHRGLMESAGSIWESRGIESPLWTF